MKQMVVAAAFVGLSLLGIEAHAIERGDPARGEQLASQCVGCHGPGGNSSNPQFPHIAGQYADYMVQAMKAYKSGARKNPIMAGIVANLSDKDLHDLAAYFARQKGQLYQRSVM
jgi:cytochrome c553